MLKRQSKYFRYTIIGSGLLVVALLGVFYFASTKNTSRSLTDQEAQTTSEAPSAQADFSEGGQRKEEDSAQRDDRGAAIVTDNGGTTNANTDSSITSPSGEITVYTPSKNSSVKSGQEISGSSSLTKVNYRIIDSSTGVIATGELQVVKGRFSGTLSFNTSAKEGRIDFFAADADGVEFSNIEIPIRFN